MIRLKELMEGHKKIKLVVEEGDYQQFLYYAKKEGCLWQSGEVIKPITSKPTKPTTIFGITSDLFLFQPNNWIRFMSLQNCPEYKYSNIKEEKVIDEYFERTHRTERIDEDYRKAEEARQHAYKRRCNENRRISQLQIKYQNITMKLQSQFFVRYENNDELLRLFLLFRNYGYENIYDIALENFTNDPKVIYVDNQNMTFYPVDLYVCSCALQANKKIYKTKDFEEMMNDIFKIQ